MLRTGAGRWAVGLLGRGGRGEPRFSSLSKNPPHLHPPRSPPSHVHGTPPHRAPRPPLLTRARLRYAEAIGERRALLRVVQVGAGVVAVGVAVDYMYPELAELPLASVPRTARALVTVIHNFADYKLSLRGAQKGAPGYADLVAEAHERAAQRVLALCQSNGGVYIKAGQFVSAISTTPPQYRAALAELQDAAPAQPYPVVQRALRQALLRDPGAVFADFEPDATAAASLAQVHRAHLLSSGDEVAVKVQYPGLQAAVKADLQVLSVFFDFAKWAFPGQQLEQGFGWILPELARQLEVEIDFLREAHNSERIARNFSHRDDLTVPRIMWDTSSSRVLVMEWVNGVKVDNPGALQAMGLQPTDVGNLLLEAFAQMMFCDGVIHGDAHAGNLLVRPAVAGDPFSAASLAAAGRGAEPPEEEEGVGGVGAGGEPRPQLVLLDHGVYSVLGEDLRRAACELWTACIFQDVRTIQRVCDELEAMAAADDVAGGAASPLVAKRERRWRWWGAKKGGAKDGAEAAPSGAPPERRWWSFVGRRTAAEEGKGGEGAEPKRRWWSWRGKGAASDAGEVPPPPQAKLWEALPLLLNSAPPGRGQDTSDERRLARARIGLRTAADVTRLLDGLPRPLLLALRTDALVRGYAEKLGSSRFRRIRTLGRYAIRGLYQGDGVGGGWWARSTGGRLARWARMQGRLVHLDWCFLRVWSKGKWARLTGRAPPHPPKKGKKDVAPV